MPNTCYSISIPKSSIVEMITVENPPAAHHAKHEDGGSDEVDCTGLTGAGGGGLPWSDIVSLIDFVSVDGFITDSYGSGALTLSGAKVVLETSGTASDLYSLEKAFTYEYSVFSWGSLRQLILGARFQGNGSSNNRVFVGLGKYASGNCAGFRVENGLFQAFSRNGVNAEVFQIADWSGAAFDHTYKLKIVVTATPSVEFWVAGTKVHTATTQVPAGTSNASHVFNGYVQNPSAGDWVALSVSHCHFWQGV